MNAKHVAHQLKLKQWAVLIQECRNSGMKTIDWCKENNISKDTYYYWFSLVRKAACAAHPELAEPIPCFAPISAESMSNRPLTAGASSVRISIGGAMVEVDQSTSPDILRMVLQVLTHV